MPKPRQPCIFKSWPSMFIGVLATALFALAQDSGREHFVTRRDGCHRYRRRDRDPQLRRFGFRADYPRSWRFLKGGAGTHESTSPEPCIDGSDRWVNMVDSKAADLLETHLKHLEIPHPKTNPNVKLKAPWCSTT